MFKTLCYADIFDYPLTATELHRWQIAGDTKKSDQVEKTGQYFHLKGRNSIVALRRRRARFSQLKLAQAQKIASLLARIPTIDLIAVTGALSMRNADANDDIDDIDLMIVTQTNRLWLTRLLVVVILEFLGLRRRPSGHNHNKVCLNLWLDQSALAIPKSAQNLYTAHEVAQARPIFNRNNTYQKFIAANIWLTKFLPNWSA